MDSLFSLAGKVAVVTGGSRGIGGMIAEGLVRHGARTYITARHADQCQQKASELSTFGKCFPLSCDLSKPAGIEALVDAVRHEEPQVHILVNNAGATWGAPIDEYPEHGWDKVMDLNVKSLFFLTQRLLGPLRAAGRPEDPARIINIASINGMTNPKMENYAYSASKAAVIHLTRHLAVRLATDHINVNAIAPGFFRSKMTSFMVEQLPEIVAATPCGRIGEPEDAAGLAIFLSSRASAWITGITIPLDGGMSAAA